MTRLLVLILLAILIYLLVSALLRRLSAAAGIGGARVGKGAPGQRPTASPTRGEALVRCAACGVRLPESRALPASAKGPGGGAVFCSEDCRRQGGHDGGAGDGPGGGPGGGAAGGGEAAR